MTETNTNAPIQSTGRAKPAQTPHELVRYHLLHPNEPITDDDIRNLKIDTGAVSKEHQLKVTEYTLAKEHGNDKELVAQGTLGEEDNTHKKEVATPYDVLSGS